MGRKRCSSYVESSDDEFEHSEAEASPVFSRLKRARRAHNRDSPAPTASPERNSFHPEDDGNTSVVIPDSLDQDDNSIAQSDATSPPQTPKDPRDDDTRETEGPSEKEDNFDREKGVEESDDIVELHDAADNNDVEQSPRNVPTVKIENGKTSGRRRQSRTVYQIESDSEDESHKGNDDDDAYKSAEDSPPEDDEDSEFDFSPKKPTKKTKKRPAKRAPLRQKAQNPPARNLATRKLATRKLATKPGLAASNASAAVGSTSKLASTSENAKRRLGARLPHRGLMAPKSLATDRKTPHSLGKLPSAPTIRSGLSRKAIVPRLHAYLPRQSAEP